MGLMATWKQQKTKTMNFKIGQEELYKQKQRREKTEGYEQTLSVHWNSVK